MIQNFDAAVKAWAVSALIGEGVAEGTATTIATTNLETLEGIAQAKYDAEVTATEHPSVMAYNIRQAVAEEVRTWTKANLVP